MNTLASGYFEWTGKLIFQTYSSLSSYWRNVVWNKLHLVFDYTSRTCEFWFNDILLATENLNAGTTKVSRIRFSSGEPGDFIMWDDISAEWI